MFAVDLEFLTFWGAREGKIYSEQEWVWFMRSLDEMFRDTVRKVIQARRQEEVTVSSSGAEVEIKVGRYSIVCDRSSEDFQGGVRVRRGREDCAGTGREIRQKLHSDRLIETKLT